MSCTVTAYDVVRGVLFASLNKLRQYAELLSAVFELK